MQGKETLIGNLLLEGLTTTRKNSLKNEAKKGLFFQNKPEMKHFNWCDRRDLNKSYHSSCKDGRGDSNTS
jgi:hypothetical protein